MSTKELYHQAEDYFFRAISKKHLKIATGVCAYLSGVPVESLNPVYINKHPLTLEKILSESKIFYAHNRINYEIIINEDLCTAEVTDHFKKQGKQNTGTSIAMGLNLESHQVTQFDDAITIKATDQHLNQWMLPLIGAFESTEEISSQYARVHENALKKGFHLYHFSMYMNEKPIASMTLSLQNHIARLDDVGTLPEYRGKGYATHLMNHALTAAKKLGATQCFLESSASGLSIYQKIGFKPLYRNTIFS